MLPGVAFSAAEHLRYDFSFQAYSEDANRIAVESWYWRGEFLFNESTSLKFQFLSDAISGASPTGALPGGPQPFLAELEDVRLGILGALSQQFGEHRVEIEVSRSQEEDYVSHGLAITDRWEFNQKNTTVALAFNFLDDSVRVFGLPDQTKNSYDFFAGLTQLLDKNTVLAANLTVGYSTGYLNDQYKSIQRTDILSISDGQGGTIDIPVVNLYRENRPNTRLRGVLQFEGRRYFDELNAAIYSALRFTHDSFGVTSQSIQMEWRQTLWDKLEITPFARFYWQSAADFFFTSLDSVPVGTPLRFPNGSGPNYSADYRLSSMATTSLGVKARYQLCEHIAFSAAYEHYDMSGYGANQAPAAAYPTASIVTVGVTVEF